MAGSPTASFAVAPPASFAVAPPAATHRGRPHRSTSPPRPSPHRSGAPKAGPFHQANMLLPNHSRVVPVIGVVTLLVVVLIPCAAAAATRYRRLR
jgi:hypothetical protein